MSVIEDILPGSTVGKLEILRSQDTNAGIIRTCKWLCCGAEVTLIDYDDYLYELVDCKIGCKCPGKWE